MYRHRVLHKSAIILATVAAAGCGSDSSPTSPTPPSVDVSAVVSQMIGARDRFPGMPSTLYGSAPTPPSPAPVVASNCQLSPPSGAFVCPPSEAGGITFNVSYYLFDAAGHPLTRSDAGGIASIRTVVDFQGTTTVPIERSVSTVVESGRGDMTLTGLLTTTHTLNGTTTAREDITITGEITAHSIAEITTTATNLVTSADTKWPKSGSVGTDTGSAESPGDGIVRAVVTFDGTSTATLTTTIDGQPASTCRVNLDAGTISCD